MDQAPAEDERGGVAHLPRGMERAVPALLAVLQDHQVRGCHPLGGGGGERVVGVSMGESELGHLMNGLLVPVL